MLKLEVKVLNGVKVQDLPGALFQKATAVVYLNKEFYTKDCSHKRTLKMIKKCKTVSYCISTASSFEFHLHLALEWTCSF